MHFIQYAPKPLTEADLRQLRDRHYNAVVKSLVRVHDELMILRVEPDGPSLQFEPGQYAILGLGYWERRISGTQSEALAPRLRSQLAKRAYSLCSPLIDDCGQPIDVTGERTLEFYVALVRQAHEAPALTPRLFYLQPGKRLYLGSKARGNYTLRQVGAGDHLVFAATGTGEAPHNAMIGALLARGHCGPITAITCVRYRRDLGYLEQHRRLAARFKAYRYFTLTTREPENLDTSRTDYVGKRYLQDIFSADAFRRETGRDLTPSHTHVFLCGNPAMIGMPRAGRADPISGREPAPHGMAGLLEEQGFRVDHPHHPGNVHFEKYW